ncbi:basic proline-rich protein-like [Ictidomys tridecemlineatus]|uniref:basic proline-rich protein-like n=1 Tax=Ictidomys tridecemlineatus TaxID=43179 RepID=UPI00038BC4CE|nr:basic proline-rich protein-like [Ictidomys tridecemlineatus]KAG3260414.1 basic proline-rich protein-like [Ictidomys tridecemlineatus]
MRTDCKCTAARKSAHLGPKTAAHKPTWHPKPQAGTRPSRQAPPGARATPRPLWGLPAPRNTPPPGNAPPGAHATPPPRHPGLRDTPPPGNAPPSARATPRPLGAPPRATHLLPEMPHPAPEPRHAPWGPRPARHTSSRKCPTQRQSHAPDQHAPPTAQATPPKSPTGTASRDPPP